MADRVGQQLGNYHLIRLLGEGGFAEVYLGEHIYLKTQAAIKVLQMRLASEDREGFLKEARTIAGLKHPHIIRVLDFGIDAGTPFLVMDYAPHGTLRKRHPKGVPLPLPTIVNYVKHIAPALQYAHERKLVHRDVKPENLLLGEDNEVLLSDFGIALVTQSSRYQSTQEVVGTAAYMAPEQLQGKPRPASDQYSLGVVVYEGLCGDRPFHGTFTELYSQHLFVPPQPLREKVPDISREVEQVVLTALEKDPHKRFASVQAFATALEQACQPAPAHQAALSIGVLPVSEPSLPSEKVVTVLPTQLPQPTNVVTPPSQSLKPTDVATPSISLSQPTSTATPTRTPAVSPPSTEVPISSGRPQPSKHRISRRAMVIGLAGLVGVSVAGGGIAWLATSQKPQVSSTSFHPITTPAPTTTPSPTPSPTPTPSGPPPGTTLYTYHGHSKVVEAVAWSPDGKLIASASDDMTVQVWDAVTGSTISTYRGHSTIVRSVAWSPDSKRIASAGFADKTVHVWNATNGGNILIYPDSSTAIWAVSWSPHDTRIASGGGRFDSVSNTIIDTTVQVWDAATGSTLLTYRGHTASAAASGVVDSIAWSPDGKRIASASINVQVWDAATGSTLLTYRGGHSDPYFVNAVAWSPDGRFIASCVNDPNDPAYRTVQVWDASTGNILYTYRGHFAQAGALLLNKTFLASRESSMAGDERVWFSKENPFSGGGLGVTDATWSPDGTRIASCADNPDKTVQVWDATTGGHVLVYRGHSNGVLTIAWSPDGKRIASGSSDKTVQVWQAV